MFPTSSMLVHSLTQLTAIIVVTVTIYVEDSHGSKGSGYLNCCYVGIVYWHLCPGSGGYLCVDHEDRAHLCLLVVSEMVSWVNGCVVVKGPGHSLKVNPGLLKCYDVGPALLAMEEVMHAGVGFVGVYLYNGESVFDLFLFSVVTHCKLSWYCPSSW